MCKPKEVNPWIYVGVRNYDTWSSCLQPIWEETQHPATSSASILWLYLCLSGSEPCVKVLWSHWVTFLQISCTAENVVGEFKQSWKGRWLKNIVQCFNEKMKVQFTTCIRRKTPLYNRAFGGSLMRPWYLTIKWCLGL